MKRAGKMIQALSGLLLCTILFGGCGNADNGASYSDAKEEAAMESAAAVEEGYYDADYEEAIAAGEDSGVAKLQRPEKETDKLIYSGNLRLQTLEYEKTRKNIHAKIEAVDGFIQWEQEYDNNDSWYYESGSRTSRNAEIQARIPSDQFSAFLESLEGEGQIMSRYVNVENITQTYRETEASVEAYEIEQKRLLEMMDKAETIEDMIAVEARLSEVEAELSRYKTSLSSMDRDVAYSTVTISIEEVRKYTEEVDDSTFFSRLKETVKSSWRGFLNFLEGLLHLIIRLLPFLILGVLIFLLIRFLDKKYGGKRHQKREEKRQQKILKKQQKAEWKRQKKMTRNGQVPPQQTGSPTAQQPVNDPMLQRTGDATPQQPMNDLMQSEDHHE